MMSLPEITGEISPSWLVVTRRAISHSSALLQRILRGQHEERGRQRMHRAAGADLPFLHRFQHGRLRFGRRSINLVGQNHVGEQRAGQELVFACPGFQVLLNHFRAGHVAGHQVGRELDALERKMQGLGQRIHQQRFGQARHSFQQRMSASKDRNQGLLDHLFLADNGLGNFVTDPIVGLLATLHGGHIVARCGVSRHVFSPG
jgi:hypothetical protein